METAIQQALNKIAEGERDLEAAIKASFPVGTKVKTKVIAKECEGTVIGYEGIKLIVEGVAKTPQARNWDKVSKI